MRPSGFSRFLFAAVPTALVLLVPATAQAFKEVDPSSDPEWAPVTLVAGQNVRLNFTNVAVDNPDYMPGDCQVQVSFLDASGRAIENPTTLELRPGQSVTVVGPTPHMRDGETPPDSPDRTMRLLRPMVRFVPPDVGDHSGIGNRKTCSVVPVMEVFSEETGATLLLSPAALKGFNPQPDPPGQE